MKNIAVNKWGSKNADEPVKRSWLNAEYNEGQVNKRLNIKGRPH